MRKTGKREEFLARIESALDELEVKAHLARLEARDVRASLQKQYDGLRDRMHNLREAGEDRWEALKDGVEASLRAFRSAYRRSMASKT